MIALKKQTHLKCQSHQEGKSSLGSKPNSDLSDPGSNSDIQLKKAFAHLQVQHLVPVLKTLPVAPKAKDAASQVNPNPQLQNKAVVWERMHSRSTQDKHNTFKHKLDLKVRHAVVLYTRDHVSLFHNDRF